MVKVGMKHLIVVSLLASMMICFVVLLTVKVADLEARVRLLELNTGLGKKSR